MKKLLITFILIVLLMSGSSFAGKSNWSGYFEVINGLNTLTKLVDALINYVGQLKLPAGTQLRITSVPSGSDYEKLAKKFQQTKMDLKSL